MTMKFVMVCALLAMAGAAPTFTFNTGGIPAPRLEAVTAAAGTARQQSVFMRDIFTDEIVLDPSTGQPQRIWGPPKEAPGGLPFSATILYLFWSFQTASAVQVAYQTDLVLSTDGGGVNLLFNTLTFSFDQQLAPGAVVQMKWEAANLEIDPFLGCAGSSSSGDCRCNALDTDRTHQYMADTLGGNPGGTTESMDTSSATDAFWTRNIDNTFTVNLQGRLPTYFEHAPFAGQNPFLRTYRRLCLRWINPVGLAVGAPPAPLPAGTRWFDTNVMISVTQPCIDPGVTTTSINTDVPLLLPQNQPFFQCNSKLTNTPYAFTGLVAGVPTTVAGNNVGFQPLPQNVLGAYFQPFFSLTPNDEVDETQDTGFAFGETAAMFNDRIARTYCCGYTRDNGNTPSNINVVPINNGGGDLTSYAPGVCIDVLSVGSTPGSKSRCCGRRPYNPSSEQCCSRASGTVRYLDQPCPCFTAANFTNIVDQAFFDPCNYIGGNAQDLLFNGAIATDTDTAAGLADPNIGGWTCCQPTKWGSAFSNGGTGTTTSFIDTGRTATVGVNSFCTNTALEPRWQCCDDGNVYDQGTSQCCPINGVQSLNSPCPCQFDTDCPANNGQLQTCCTQTFPTPFATPHVSLAANANSPALNPFQQNTCSKFANWPRQQQQLLSGQDYFDNTPGASQLQRCPGTCYNSLYQICCNGRTCLQNFERCCNDTCCNHYTESCMIGRRPGALGNRYNPREWSVFYETCSQLEYLNGRKAFFVFVLPSILLFATLLSLAFVTILARRATEHIFELTERAMVFCAVVSVFLSCTYYFSPIYKNGVAIAFVALGAILIAVARKRSASLFLVIVLFFLILYVIDPFSGNIYLSLTSNMPVRGAPKSSSLLEAALNMWIHNDRCTYYYQWFVHDNSLRDVERFDNPAQLTWGFCSRAWVTALMIFALMLYVLLLLLFLLAIFSLVKKLGVKDVEPIELEIAYDDGVAPFAPAPPAPYFVG